jgi:hypothetical protein
MHDEQFSAELKRINLRNRLWRIVILHAGVAYHGVIWWRRRGPLSAVVRYHWSTLQHLVEAQGGIGDGKGGGHGHDVKECGRHASSAAWLAT